MQYATDLVKFVAYISRGALSYYAAVVRVESKRLILPLRWVVVWAEDDGFTVPVF